MSQKSNIFFKFIIIAMVVLGLSLIFKDKAVNPEINADVASSKALVLKNYLLKFQKPERVEIIGLSTTFETEISQIKKLKVMQDKNSDFYVVIRLFADESDSTAPLVAQIQFVDVKTGNLRKEESINLK